MKNKKQGNDQLAFRSDYAELQRIREYIVKNALSFGFDDTEANRISLAVDEACSNLIKYAYKLDKNRIIRLIVETNKKNFIIKIIDDGIPFNPMDVPLQDMKGYIEKMQRGGLGIHIIRSVMDEIFYYPSSKNRPENILELQKSLN